MDKRQWISAISLSAAVFALWLAFSLWYQKNHPQPPVSSTPAATQPASTEPAPAVVAATNPTTGPTSGPTSGPTVAAPASPAVHVAPSTQPFAGPVLLGSDQHDDPNFSAQLSIIPEGAALSDVVLNHFYAPDEGSKRKSDKKSPYRFEESIPEHPETRVLASRAVVIDGHQIDLWNVPWSLVTSDGKSATFKVVIDDAAGNPLAQITKTYALTPRNSDTKGYEVAVTQTIRNLQPDKPIKVHALINGPTPPPTESLQGIDRAVIVGYKEAGETINNVIHGDSDFKPDSAEKDLTTDGKNHPWVWSGQQSAYFAAIVLATDNPGASGVTARALALNPGGGSESHHVTLSFQTADATLAPGKETTLPLNVFFGPKWRDVMDTPHYAGWPRMYNLLLIVKSSMCGFCTWSWLISTLVAILSVFHRVFRDWGLAIIGLVVLVRFLLHPITKKSQVQMMKMGKLGPEVEKLKKKFADQPDVLNREMMKLYKQQGGAILGCLPMFLQTPIWIALWSALQSTFELRQAPFLFGWTWIHDLSKPDTMIDLAHWFGGPVPLYVFGWHLYAINLLPMLMAVVTYVNQKYFMPMPIAATPEQEQQQKMQRGMSLLFPLMFYNMPSGLNLYYLTSMSLGILESKIIRDHIKEQEELAKAQGPELVPMKPTRASRRGAGAPDADKAPEKQGLMYRFVEAMQKAQQQAEEMKKDKGKGKK